MIQRIQTVYLGLALLSQLAQFFLSWVMYYSQGEEYSIAPLSFDSSPFSVIPLTLVLSLSLGLVIGTTFGYNNRKNQMKLGRMAMASVILGFVAFAFVHYMNIRSFDPENELMMSYQLIVALPFVSAILIWLANKSIKKDEDLVRSVDRLR